MFSTDELNNYIKEAFSEYGLDDVEMHQYHGLRSEYGISILHKVSYNPSLDTTEAKSELIRNCLKPLVNIDESRHVQKTYKDRISALEKELEETQAELEKYKHYVEVHKEIHQ